MEMHPALRAEVGWIEGDDGDPVSTISLYVLGGFVGDIGAELDAEFNRIAEHLRYRGIAPQVVRGHFTLPGMTQADVRSVCRERGLILSPT